MNNKEIIRKTYSNPDLDIIKFCKECIKVVDGIKYIKCDNKWIKMDKDDEINFALYWD